MRQVSKVICRAGVLVDQIKFVYADGEEKAWGGCGGDEQEPFMLEADEVITGIEGTHREWSSHPGQVLLGSFRVTTSKGRTSPWQGQHTQVSDNILNNKLGNVSHRASEDNPIVGINRLPEGVHLHVCILVCMFLSHTHTSSLIPARGMHVRLAAV